MSEAREADHFEVVRVAARAYERDRYLSALLAPGAVRSDLLVLAAFAGDVGRIPSFVSEPMMGELRLQWWRDTVGGGAAQAAATGNPIADLMNAVVGKYSLHKDCLTDLIESQSLLLDGEGFASDAELDQYIDKREGALSRLYADVLCPGGLTADEAGVVRGASRAIGYTRVLIEAAARRFEGRVLFPRSRLEAAGLSRPAVLAGAEDGSKLAALFAVYRAMALDEYRAVHARWRGLRRGVRLSVLPVVLVARYLRAHEAAGLSAMSQVPDILPLCRVSALWGGARLRLMRRA
jgi:phytoene synthase